MVVERYLKYLYLRKDEEMASVALPDISRKMIGKMKEYYKVINNEAVNESEKPASSAVQLTPF
jgi:O-acetyl-ADP-ribose deacetylase (regulator of RNase III)